MSWTTLLTRVICRAGCGIAVLAALASFTPRAAARASRDGVFAPSGTTPSEAIGESRGWTQSESAHRRTSPTALRAERDTDEAVVVRAPRVVGVEIETAVAAFVVTPHVPRAPPAAGPLAIRAS